MLTILHASDLHFGKHFDPAAVGAFRGVLDETAPDLLVLSGDFTQRAKVGEYGAAREFLRELPDLPVVVTPGNHDVPLYRVWERLLTPRKNYREFISDQLDTVTRVEGATVVALDSSAPRRAIVNGHLANHQLEFATQAFRKAPPEDLKILVTHHNLAPAPDHRPEPVLPGHERWLEALAGLGVEMILGGHLHRAFIASSLDVQSGPQEGPGILLVHSGTTMSLRGRAREKGKNSLNVVRAEAEKLQVIHYVRGRGEETFFPFATHTFPRGKKEGGRQP